ncbi:CYTOCHROME P450 71D10 [Salix viminalis]|uniref:CYTOCHROME P450 71D10 n=1 Tax=Salix viminalis TaxID=40686 RepID=A0A9Q0U6I7_SALVM|nr:CYTOCHROME P450 71D10 [Salix viminalis]
MEQLLPSFPVLITILLFISIFWTRTKLIRSNESSPNPPPGPWKLPFIGNIHQLLHPLFHHRLRDLAKKFGPVMQLQIGEVPTVIISSSEAAKEVMKTHEINFVDRPHLLVASILLYNRKGFVFAPYGDYWRELRKISILELLSAKRVRSFKSIREEEVSDFIGSIYAKEGSPINLSRMIFSLGNGIIARASIGKKCKTQEAFLPVLDELSQALGGLNMADVFPSSRFFRMVSRVRSRLERMHREADEMLDSIISERRANSGLASKMAKNEAEDLLGVLLNLQEHGNPESQLTTSSIKATILEMFSGGGDTSSTALEWAMSNPIKNPRVMKKAQKEVRQVFDDIGTVPDETNLQDLKFLKLVIKETLRLHPSLAVIPRECRKRCEVHGYDIDVKSRVLINAWAIGRDRFIGMKSRNSVARDSSMFLLILRVAALSSYHLELERECVQACHLLSPILSLHLRRCYTILTGNLLMG